MAKTATSHDDIERSIDRSLDDMGRFLRHRWWAVLLVLVLMWYVIFQVIPAIIDPADHSGTLTIVTFAAQLAFGVVFIVIQFVALFWFLGRPRIYWVLPGEAGVGFDDYKGNPEVLEAARRIVTLMRGVRGFKEMGGEISRGLLLVGPPGTGKSYLAQCISTEAGVPFAYASAASFRAMFIGMDVLMIKNLYRKARRLAREFGGCIIFMDEFDAIGMSRGSSQGGGTTMGMGAGGFMGMGGTGGLNELLMQMDPPPTNDTWWKKALRTVGLYRGTNKREPVLTIGATNIPESLDAALLRPGRFDRKIVVAPPSDAHRAEVIAYYLDNVRHEPIPMQKLVSDMMGYTPVAIKHVINEAVVIAHFDGRDSVTYHDIVAARETHEYGIRYPRTLSTLEKRRLAYHEAGHAIAQAYLLPRYRVAHATIVKRLGSSGEAFVEAKPLEEIVTQSAEEVFARIQVSLASRASEELFLQARLNGVGGDLANATQLALQYVAHWGMGDTFFSAAATMAPERMYTDPILREQAERLLRQAYVEVRELLERRRKAVIAVAEALLEREELDSDEIEQLIREAETPPEDQVMRLAQMAESALAPVALGQPVVEGDHTAALAPAAIAGSQASGVSSESGEGNIPNARATAAAASDSIEPEIGRQTSPKRDVETPAPIVAPPTFAATPSQMLRADRVIDRALLHAPLRAPLAPATDPSAPVVRPNERSSDARQGPAIHQASSGGEDER